MLFTVMVSKNHKLRNLLVREERSQPTRSLTSSSWKIRQKGDNRQMSRTKIRLDSQALVTDDVNCGAKNFKNLADPVDAQDAATKNFVSTFVSSGSGSVAIGNAEDNGGLYTDGLFTDLTATTPIGTAVDRFNEVLKSLSPQPAPSLASVGSNTGVNGKLSFGTSNVVSGYTAVPGLDINGSYAVGGTRLGIVNGATAITGALANNVTPNFTNSRPYPNLAFGDANMGLLHLKVNGTIVKTINLATFSSGTSVSANGSGFNLTAATPVQFTNGDAFNVFMYRTGTWTVAAADQAHGYNTAQVLHEYTTGSFRSCQIFDWVVDADVTATTFSSETLSSLSMTGLRQISGVKYNTGGTAQYGVAVNNVYRNTYSPSATALSYNGTNVTIVKDALSNMTTQADSVIVANKTATVNATRLLNGSLSVSTTVSRTVQSSQTSTGATIAGILLENTADSSTVTNTTFNGEGRRIHAGLSLSTTSYGTGVAGSQPAAWDSTLSLVGADANHNTGLLVYNGVLQYPKTNFSTITNGPASNVNYSSAAGNRTFICFFYDSGAHSNFKFNVTAASTSFVSVATGPSGNNLTFEVLAPNTTKNSGGTPVFKDAVVAYSGVDSDAGAYASTFGSTVPTNWGCTIGTKNTSTSGNVIVVKITAAAAWTGSISSIAITWL
jgi:hypothetical protein